MVMNDPDSVAQFHAGGVSNPGMVATYDFGARALDALMPPGGRLLDLGVGSGRARPLPYLQAYWIPSAHLKPSASTSGRRATVHGRARPQAALLRWGFTARPF
jgi:hypothetical protein